MFNIDHALGQHRFRWVRGVKHFYPMLPLDPSSQTINPGTSATWLIIVELNFARQAMAPTSNGAWMQDPILLQHNPRSDQLMCWTLSARVDSTSCFVSLFVTRHAVKEALDAARLGKMQKLVQWPTWNIAAMSHVGCSWVPQLSPPQSSAW